MLSSVLEVSQQGTIIEWSRTERSAEITKSTDHVSSVLSRVAARGVPSSWQIGGVGAVFYTLTR